MIGVNVSRNGRQQVMRWLLKPAAEHLAKPLLQRYLRRPRTSRYLGLELTVPPGVFHPGFFFSSRCFARFLNDRQMRGQRILDLGCGAGLLALVCASKGAMVTAVDVNPAAVTATRKNALVNDLQIECKESNLFVAVADEAFDLVIVNPPYFRADPVGDAGRAWCAGTHFEYFEAFFAGLAARFGGQVGEALMILADICELEAIDAVAAQHGLTLRPVYQEWVLWEQQFIFQVVERV